MISSITRWWGNDETVITWWWGNDETVSQGRSGQYIDQLQFLATDGSSYGPYGDLSSHCILIYILLCREQCSLWASFPFCGRSHFLFAGRGGGSRLDLNLKSRPRFNFVTSTKHQQQNTDQTSASKSRLNFNFKILTKVLKVWTKVKLYDQTSASKSATNCCQHDPHH